MSCTCPGNLCTCDGAPKLKDGATLSLPLMLKDTSMATEQPPKITADTMPSAEMSLADAVKLPRYAGMWPSQAQQFAARDLAMARAGKETAPGYQEGVRDHYNERMSDAWKGPSVANDKVPSDPLYAADGRPFDNLSDSDKARERMAQQMSDAWKA